MAAVFGRIEVGGPYYEELRRGQRFDDSPGLTLTDGHAALHQAIVGDRLRLPLDHHLAATVTGDHAPVAHPGLVCDVAIGQSTLATQRVIANLFYRGLALRRAPRIGDTLRSSTEVVALRDTSPRPGRVQTGLAVLHIRTVDQQDRAVLDFHRCAMLPMRPEAVRPEHADDIDAFSAELDRSRLLDSVAGWNLEPLGTGDVPEPGTEYVTESGETVTCATELVRMTLNVAAAHSHPGESGRRLVYGGHTIGIALSQVSRALPRLVTVAAWRSCDHLAPVLEGDVLTSTIKVEAVDGNLIDLRVRTSSDRPVLDWRLIGVIA